MQSIRMFRLKLNWSAVVFAVAFVTFKATVIFEVLLYMRLQYGKENSFATNILVTVVGFVVKTALVEPDN